MICYVDEIFLEMEVDRNERGLVSLQDQSRTCHLLIKNKYYTYLKPVYFIQESTFYSTKLLPFSFLF
jgi:hypothetical protein